MCCKFVSMFMAVYTALSKAAEPLVSVHHRLGDKLSEQKNLQKCEHCLFLTLSGENDGTLQQYSCE